MSNYTVGKSTIRPLAQFKNRSESHTLSVFDEFCRVDQKHHYQTMRNDVNYDNLVDVEVNMKDMAFDPMSRNVKIHTKGRDSFEIPDMDTLKAMKFKETVETQQAMIKRDQKMDQKKAFSRSVGTFSPHRR